MCVCVCVKRKVGQHIAMVVGSLAKKKGQRGQRGGALLLCLEDYSTHTQSIYKNCNLPYKLIDHWQCVWWPLVKCKRMCHCSSFKDLFATELDKLQ